MTRRCKQTRQERFARAFAWTDLHLRSGDMDPHFIAFPKIQNHFGTDALWQFMASRTYLRDMGAMLYSVSSASPGGWAGAIRWLSDERPPEFHVHAERRPLYHWTAAMRAAEIITEKGEGNLLRRIVQESRDESGAIHYQKVKERVVEIPTLGLWGTYDFISQVKSSGLEPKINWDGVEYPPIIREGASHMLTGDDKPMQSQEMTHRVITDIMAKWRDTPLRAVPYYDRSMEECDVETVLCKFLHTDRKGYFHGHDTIMMRKNNHKWYPRFRKCKRAVRVLEEMEQFWQENEALKDVIRKMDADGFLPWGEQPKQKTFSFAGSKPASEAEAAPEEPKVRPTERAVQEPTPPLLEDPERWGVAIHVMGSFASGKSYLVRELLGATETDPLVNSDKDPFARGEQAGCPFSVFGPYRHDVAVGGMDTLMTKLDTGVLIDMICDEVKRGRAVVFEHALSISINRTKEIIEAVGNRYALITLDLPLEVREDNLRKRREARGSNPDITEKTRRNMVGKQEGIMKHLAKTREMFPSVATHHCTNFDAARVALKQAIGGQK